MDPCAVPDSNQVPLAPTSVGADGYLAAGLLMSYRSCSMVLVGLVADIVKDSIRRTLLIPRNGRDRPGADAAEAVAARGRNRRRGHQDVPRDRKRNVLDRYTAGCRRCFACAPKPASRNSPMRRHAAEWATPRSISQTPAPVSAQRRHIGIAIAKQHPGAAFYYSMAEFDDRICTNGAMHATPHPVRAAATT